MWNYVFLYFVLINLFLTFQNCCVKHNKFKHMHKKKKILLIWIYIHIYCFYSYLYTYIYRYICLYIQTHIYTHMHTHTHSHTSAYRTEPLITKFIWINKYCLWIYMQKKNKSIPNVRTSIYIYILIYTLISSLICLKRGRKK